MRSRATLLSILLSICPMIGSPTLSSLGPWVAAAAGLAACGGAAGNGGAPAAPAVARATPVGAALYDRRGRRDAIAAVGHVFVANRVAQDRRIKAYFRDLDGEALEAKLVDQLCEASGGPCKYTGKDMKTVHAGMGVTEGDFRALIEDLRASLDHFRVPEREQKDLLALLAPMHDAIVTAK